MKIFVAVFAVLVLAKHVPTVFGFYGLCVNKATFKTTELRFFYASRLGIFGWANKQTQLSADEAMGVVN